MPRQTAANLRNTDGDFEQLVPQESQALTNKGKAPIELVIIELK